MKATEQYDNRQSLPIYNPHLEGEAFLWEGGPIGVLLSHGFTATTAEVRLLGKLLHAQGYTISAPLLPGHNSRPEDLNRVHWRDWVAAVDQAYLELRERCDPVFVGGESTGALLALYLAAQHPEILGVLAYAPALKLKMSSFDRLRLYLAAPFIPYVPKENMDSDTPWQGYPVNPLRGVIQLLELQKEILRRLPSIRQPVLIVQGRLDTSVHPSVPALIAEKVGSTDKEIHWMEHSRHVVILDKELDQVAEITQNFISRVCLHAGQN